jgi:hypothetical protein
MESVVTNFRVKTRSAPTMLGYFGSGTFAELEQALIAASKWLASRGANVRTRRIGRYMRLMRQLVVAHETKNFSALNGRGPEIAAALYEAHDVISIHRAFSRGAHADSVAERILQACSGPVSYTDENPSTSSNAARNFAFELLVAERAIVGGASPHFPVYADVGLRIPSAELAIQCKRLWASIDYGSVERNFKRAEDDLRIAKDAGARAIIAFDITRAVNPDFIIPTAGGLQEVRTQMVDLARGVVNTYGRLWNQHKPGTIALLTRVTALIQQVDTAMFTHSQQYSLTPLQNISDSEYTIVNEFSAVLAAATAADAQRHNSVTTS